MTNDQELRNKIMRRVYVMYAFRQATKPTVRAGAFIASVVLSLGSVSIPNVVTNLLSVSGLSGLFNFMVSAIQQTELLVQIAVPLALIILVGSLIEVVRKSSSEKRVLA